VILSRISIHGIVKSNDATISLYPLSATIIPRRISMGIDLWRPLAAGRRQVPEIHND
jgi:hypothetical protein